MLWDRDRDPFLDGLRLRLHRRLLLVSGTICAGLGLLRYATTERVDLLPLACAASLAAWALLDRWPGANRGVARSMTLLFLAVGVQDLLSRPLHDLPWAVFALMVLPAYGTLVDGIVAGGAAAATTVGACLWSGQRAANPSAALLTYFAALGTLCFYATCLAYTWSFGALVDRRRRSQAAVESAGRAAGSLAQALSAEVIVATGRLRAGLQEGLQGLEHAAGLRRVLNRIREQLPQDLPAGAVDPRVLLDRQRHAAHRVYLMLAAAVCGMADAAVDLLSLPRGWLAGSVAWLSLALLVFGERMDFPWRWRMRIFLAGCLGATAVDILFCSSDLTPPSSIVLMPLLLFYSGMLDTPLATAVAAFVGAGLMAWAGLHVPLGQPFQVLVVELAAMGLGMLGFAWNVLPIYRDLLDELAETEEGLRRGLHAYRRLVSTLFHDLANPLSVLQTLASLPPSMLRPEDTDRADRMVERLESVTAAARQAGGEAVPAAADAPAAWGRVAEGLHDLFRDALSSRAITWRLGGDTQLPLQSRDPRQRDNVLGHLLSNAVRFSPEGGSISLDTRREGPWTVLRLRDQGSGFPNDVLDQLARGAAPKPRPDRRGDTGNGFGLLLAQAYARDLGGWLELSNPIDGGALAELWLPAA